MLLGACTAHRHRGASREVFEAWAAETRHSNGLRERFRVLLNTQVRQLWLAVIQEWHYLARKRARVRAAGVAALYPRTGNIYDIF